MKRKLAATTPACTRNEPAGGNKLPVLNQLVGGTTHLDGAKPMEGVEVIDGTKHAVDTQSNVEPPDDTAKATICHAAVGAAAPGSYSERSVHSINGAKGGRPMRDVDMDEVRRLIAGGKSVKSTALFLSIGEGTLRRRLGLMYGRRGESASTPRQKPLGGTLS